MSAAVTEWVSAPTEIRSTPVAATSRTLSRVMFPEASSGIFPATRSDRPGHLRKPHIVEEDRIRSGGQRLFQFGHVLHLDLDLQGMGNPFANPLYGRADPAGRGDMVVLDQDPVIEGKAVVVPSPHANGVLVEDPQSRRGFSGIQDFCPGSR